MSTVKNGFKTFLISLGTGLGMISIVFTVLKADIDKANEKTQMIEVALAEVKSDYKHILETLNRIEKKISDYDGRRAS